MKFTEIKDKIQNLGEYESLEEIKQDGLRVVRNMKTRDYWLIEEEFLVPCLKNPQEVSTIKIDSNQLKFKLLKCHAQRKRLGDSFVADYIEWGETQGYNKRSSMKGRTSWYDLGRREPAILNFNYLVNEVGTTFIGKIFVSDNLHEIRTEKQLGLFLNSAVFWMIQNLEGRASFGGGLLKIQAYELEEMLVLETRGDMTLDGISRSQNVFRECGIDPRKPIREQEPEPLADRKALDDIVFDVLGLTEEERNEVYWSLCELVKNRLEKARSV